MSIPSSLRRRRWRCTDCRRRGLGQSLAAAVRAGNDHAADTGHRVEVPAPHRPHRPRVIERRPRDLPWPRARPRLLERLCGLLGHPLLFVWGWSGGGDAKLPFRPSAWRCPCWARTTGGPEQPG